MSYNIHIIILFYVYKDLAPTPWKAILLSPAIWALIVVEIGFDWGAYTIVNDLPKYMNDVLHFSVKQVSFDRQTFYKNILLLIYM